MHTRTVCVEQSQRVQMWPRSAWPESIHFCHFGDPLRRVYDLHDAQCLDVRCGKEEVTKVDISARLNLRDVDAAQRWEQQPSLIKVRNECRVAYAQGFEGGRG